MTGVYAFSFLSAHTGSSFIKLQCPWIADWNNISAENQAKWFMEFGVQGNGYACDRAIFLLEGVGFVACAWSGEDYTWMTVMDGTIMTVKDKSFREDKVKCMASM